MPGMGELLIILVIVLLIFGAGKLPAIGKALGQSIKNFRTTAASADDSDSAQQQVAGGGIRGDLVAAKETIEDAAIVVRRTVEY